MLDIDNSYDEIPADTLAVVGNRSAVGEQYVELQPQRNDGPYLHDGSVIDEQDTASPDRHRHPAHPPVRDRGVGRQGRPEDHRRRARRCLRRHRQGPPDDHRQRQLVHQHRQRQLRRHHGADPGQQHRPARPDRLRVGDPELLLAAPGVQHACWPARTPTCATSSTPAASRPPSCGPSSSRTASSSATSSTTWSPPATSIVKHLDGIKQILVIYPYVVEGGFTVVSKSPDTGLYDAHFGMILTTRRSATRAMAAPTPGRPRTARAGR